MESFFLHFTARICAPCLILCFFLHPTSEMGRSLLYESFFSKKSVTLHYRLPAIPLQWPLTIPTYNDQHFKDSQIINILFYQTTAYLKEMLPLKYKTNRWRRQAYEGQHNCSENCQCQTNIIFCQLIQAEPPYQLSQQTKVISHNLSLKNTSFHNKSNYLDSSQIKLVFVICARCFNIDCSYPFFRSFFPFKTYWTLS